MIETKFKQTEAGLIPEDWNTYTINDLFDIGNGYTPSKSNPLYWTNGSIPWFRMEDIRKNGRILADSIQHITPIAVKNGKLFPAGSFILSTTATIGEYALLIADSLANQRFSFLTKKLNRNHIVDTNYFFHYLYKIGDWCRKNINEGGLMAVNMEDFKKYECAIPSLAEQQRIASALTSIDNVINSLDKLISKTRDIKQGAMQRLLTPLYNNPAILKPLGDVVYINDGYPFDSATFRDEGKYAIVRITDIINYKVIRGDKHIECLPTRINANQILRGEEILVAMSGSTGKVGYNKKKNLVVNQRIAILRNRDNIMNDYLKHMLLNPLFEEYCFKQGTGIQNNISKNTIIRYLVPHPSLSIQERIASILTSLDNKIASLEAKHNKYEMIKKGMMQQLLTGKIRLKA